MKFRKVFTPLKEGTSEEAMVPVEVEFDVLDSSPPPPHPLTAKHQYPPFPSLPSPQYPMPNPSVRQQSPPSLLPIFPPFCLPFPLSPSPLIPPFAPPRASFLPFFPTVLPAPTPPTIFFQRTIIPNPNLCPVQFANQAKSSSSDATLQCPNAPTLQRRRKVYTASSAPIEG